jgi:hypothetical protein
MRRRRAPLESADRPGEIIGRARRARTASAARLPDSVMSSAFDRRSVVADDTIIVRDSFGAIARVEDRDRCFGRRVIGIVVLRAGRASRPFRIRGSRLRLRLRDSRFVGGTWNGRCGGLKRTYAKNGFVCALIPSRRRARLRSRRRFPPTAACPERRHDLGRGCGITGAPPAVAVTLRHAGGR